MTDSSAIPPSNSSGGAGSARSILSRFVHDLIRMPHWHKGVLGAALVVVLFGWGHRGYHAITDSDSTSSTGIQQTTPTTQPAPSALASWARRAGTSVLLGFLIGWVFRTFVKIMMSITAIVLGGMLLLSYFNVTNLDLTAAKNKYNDTSSWITDQAGRLRDDALGHIHSTLGGALGLFVGLRGSRKR